MKSAANIVSALLAIADAHRHADQPQATLCALDDAIARLVGRKLLTVLSVYPEEGFVERAYSNMGAQYPVGGVKRISETPRLHQVLATGEAFVGRTREDILANYPDAETIFATGCASILNMPVVWKNRIVATVNLLHTEGFYDSDDLPLVRCLSQAALPAFLERTIAAKPATHEIN
jgi:transcriptional regulator with GAF, ATPase, and Fis domain